jgi:glyoxylase-like metal-dependent hydrolase (beta-lactamase superfamily II)
VTAELRVLKDGSIFRNEQGAILDASSAVVLVLAPDLRLVVDTGLPRDATAVLSALVHEGLRPDDVDMVFNTHNHGDHTGCNDRFGRAVVVLHELEGEPPVVRNRVRHIDGPSELAPGVQAIETPGHTRGHMSVVVEARGGPWVVAGDALPTLDNLRMWVPPGVHYDRELALRSLGRIASLGRWVVPGHGAPFEVASVKVERPPPG